MSFADWVSNGWLVAHESSKQEIGNLLGIVARHWPVFCLYALQLPRVARPS